MIFTVNDMEYALEDVGWTHDSISGRAGILFRPEDHGIQFVDGDAVYFYLEITDSTEYCADNSMDTTLSFTLEPNVSCYTGPNPFSPNGDAYNNLVFFDYPEMFTKAATLRIFSKRKELIKEMEIGPSTGFGDYEVRNWDGRDKNGALMTQGLYLYTIEVDGEVVCQGSIVLLR